MNAVHIVDMVVLPAAEAEPWLRRWRSDYLPGARDRGMVSERVWRTWTGPDTVAVLIAWSLPDSGAFFAARAASGADPQVAEFWRHTDEIALERDRQVLEPAGLRAPGSQPTGATRWVALLPADGAEKYGGAAAAVPGVSASSAGPDLPGSFGGRGATWDVTADQGRTLADIATELGVPEPSDAVALVPVRSRSVPLSGRRVKRTLLFAVRPGTPRGLVARLESDLLAMPDHISTIRSWALSRVDQSLTPSRWTHVWEQEYADVEGLTGEYLNHPYHWTRVDRWFDSEIPGGGIVDPQLAHVFRWSDGPVLVPGCEPEPDCSP